MLNRVIVPKATISMEEGTILHWFKAEGERVTKDEKLFELETDKATIEVPSPADGLLLRIVVPSGLVKVETVAGWVGEPGDVVPAVVADPPPAPVNNSSPPPPKADKGPALAATPAARRRAKELGLELGSLQGTGPGGRITQEDVESAVQSGSRPRRKLASHLSAAWQQTPHIHVSRRLDARGLLDAKRIVSHVSITDLLLYVLSRVLERTPELTQVWEGSGLGKRDGSALSFAVDTDRGVVTPVIHDARALGIEQISARRREMAEASRKGRLKLEELEGGAFTLTNLGMEGVDFFAPIINTPQTAILAVGQISQEPVVLNGEIRVGWRLWATVAVDHRVLDGVAAGRFLAYLQSAIDQLPDELHES